MRRAAALGLLLLAAAACRAEEPAGGGRASLTPAEEAACIARGGVVALGGMVGITFCAERAPDAGKPCRREGDCTGRCMAETRTCQVHLNPFGCYSFLDAQGKEVAICVD